MNFLDFWEKAKKTEGFNLLKAPKVPCNDYHGATKNIKPKEEKKQGKNEVKIHCLNLI
jgi:hypothetical protein